MDDHFLYLVAKEVLTIFNGRLGNCAVIFPNKRPELYFIRALKRLEYSGLLPSFYSIESFIDENAGVQAADPVNLLLLLFKIYLKYYPETDFDSFYSWGTMMLRDFDEIDRYMADPSALFKNLDAVKDLEKYFLEEQSLPFDMLPELRPEDEQYLKKRFLETWQVYKESYFDFKKELSVKNLAYSGMNYRTVAEKSVSGDLNSGADKYIFIGFNAISKAEEIIFQNLIEAGKALIYWDGDKYFVDNVREGSGYFIRRSMQRLHGYNPQLFGDKLLTEAKEIHLIGAPLQVGQAKVLEVELKKHLQNHQSGTIAIVLTDEDMLLPVLYALPENAESVNITSGFPLKFTSLYGLFHGLIDLINNYRQETHSFYHKDVLSILSHPFVRVQNNPLIVSLTNKIQKEQLIYVPLWEFSKGSSSPDKQGLEILQLYFREVWTVIELNDYFRDIFRNIATSIDEESDEVNPFKAILVDLSDLVTSHENEISKKTYLRIFKEKVSQVSASAPRQDLEAVQLMGMLETRCLDFDTVFMLPVNEGIIPETQRNRSYIPFDIRKNFGLPTNDEQEYLYSYNFYRLLQRAKNIYLLYNSETSSGGEEKSRYIRQVEYYLPKANPNIHIFQRSYGLPLKNLPAKEIIVQKEQNYFDVLSEKNKTGFSPTFLSSYFICSLQFYFKNILRIPEKETIVEDLEAKHFGTLFHGLMEKMYEGLKGVQVDGEILAARKSTMTVAMSIVLDRVHGRQKDQILQKNSILVETVKILAEKAIEADIEYAPFRLIDTEVEASYQVPFHSDGYEIINLKGIIDRIDEKEGITRIVDYKTGHVKSNQFNFKEPDETLHKDNKEAFQTLFYGLLYLKNNPSAALKPSILPLRDVTNGYIDVNAQEGLFGKEVSGFFEEKLKSIIHSILDPDLPIAQTTDLNICHSCSYKNMCMR